MFLKEPYYMLLMEVKEEEDIFNQLNNNWSVFRVYTYRSIADKCIDTEMTGS